jgi:hypothetical protein
MRVRLLVGNIAAAAAVIVAALFLYAVFDIGLFYGPWPWQSPREQDRIVHPLGFSIIKPQGWRERIYVRHDPVPYEDAIRLNPNSKARLTPFYTVRRLVTSPDFEKLKTELGYRPVKFQGRDALGHEGVSGKFWSVGRIFERQGNWYWITLLLPDEEGKELKVHPDWWAYLESFSPKE